PGKNAKKRGSAQPTTPASPCQVLLPPAPIQVVPCGTRPFPSSPPRHRPARARLWSPVRSSLPKRSLPYAPSGKRQCAGRPGARGRLLLLPDPTVDHGGVAVQPRGAGGHPVLPAQAAVGGGQELP